MQRYFVKNSECTAAGARITGGDLHHVKHVMRMKPGAEVHVVDEDGHARLAVLRGYLEDAALFDFVKDLEPASAPGSVTIAQALIKKDKFELMLEKATELGVAAIIPTAFSRSVVKIDSADEPRKLERFRSIVKEAAEQSRRTTLPQIHPITEIQDLSFAAYDRVFVCYEASTPADQLAKVVRPEDLEKRLLFVIGPEGGIAPAELADVTGRGAIVCGLGSRILRSETASMYLLAAIDAMKAGRS